MVMKYVDSSINVHPSAKPTKGRNASYRKEPYVTLTLTYHYDDSCGRTDG